MKASNAYNKLAEAFHTNPMSVWSNTRSKVDETKTLTEMFNSWLNLLESYPDMRIGSMIRYNINRDFNCL